MIAWMLYATGIAALLGLAALAAERVCLAANRSTRWCWAAAVGGSAVLPLLAPWIRRSAVRAGESVGGAEIGAVTVLDTGPAQAAGVVLGVIDPVLAAGWVAGSLTLLLLVLFSMARLNRRRRGWSPRIVAGKRVLVSRDTGPALVGFRLPDIVLPEWVLSWDSGSLRLLVAHEREHESARDPMLLLGALGALVLVPWNLPVWWQVRRLRLAIEVDCDARVLHRHPEPRAYGHLLLEVGRHASGAELAVAAFSEPRSFLERRMRLMAKPRRIRPPALALFTLLAAGAPALASAVPAPDAPAVARLVAGTRADVEIAAPAADTLPEVGREPTFTPYTERPGLSNRQELPDLLRRAYPPLLRDAGVGGTVVLWLFIDESGAVRNTRVASGSGHAALDEAANRVAREFRFTPARNRGERVPVWIQLPVTFAAEERRSAAAPVSEPTRRVAVWRAPPRGDTVRAADVREPRAAAFDESPRLANREEAARALEAAYPSLLREAGVGGTTLLWVHIDEAGRVVDTRIHRSSGQDALDRAASTALRSFRFTPARHRGEPVSVWIQLPVSFQTKHGLI